MNIVLQQDIDNFSKTFDLYGVMDRSVFLVTGATGLIGSVLIRCLLALNNNIQIIAVVRDINRAKALFDGNNNVEFIDTSIDKINQSIIPHVDYIVHCAAPTTSKYFVEFPVETVDFIYQSTRSLLEMSKVWNVKSFVFLSSLEVYGSILDSDLSVDESCQGFVDPLDIRSSYPMAKRLAETLCCSYCKEYNIPVKIARLTQTTGAGISKDDNRVIAQFTKLATLGRDIVLHTTGESARTYCYLMDSISGILYILLKGENGRAYNVSNDETFISAKDLALLIQHIVNPSIKVKIELNDNMGYAPVSKIKLDTSLLKSLGWKPKYSMSDIILRLSEYVRSIE